LIGLTLAKNVNSKSVLLASLACSAAFYLITNFGVWQSGTMYPKTSVGLAACYTAGLPFLMNSLIGDLSFAALLFGGFEYAQKHFKALKLA
jgi:hypothetical protein